MNIKRYDLGREYIDSVGAPEIVEKADGRYVLHDDFEACLSHNNLLSLQLRQAKEQRGEPSNKDGSYENWLWLSQTEFNTDDLNKQAIELARLAWDEGRALLARYGSKS